MNILVDRLADYSDSSPHTVPSPFVLRPHDFSSEGFNDWAFMTTHSWDENPQGEWTLEIENEAGGGGHEYGNTIHQLSSLEIPLHHHHTKTHFLPVV